VIGSIFAATYASHVNVSGLSSQVASQVKNSYATATKMPAPIPGRASTAFVSAMHNSLLTAAGAALLAAVGVFILLAGRLPRASRHPSAGSRPVSVSSNNDAAGA
jgi:hypothetical protein